MCIECHQSTLDRHQMTSNVHQIQIARFEALAEESRLLEIELLEQMRVQPPRRAFYLDFTHALTCSIIHVAQTSRDSQIGLLGGKKTRKLYQSVTSTKTMWTVSVKNCTRKLYWQVASQCNDAVIAMKKTKRRQEMCCLKSTRQGAQAMKWQSWSSCN